VTGSAVTTGRAYTNPYLAGVGLGLVLLAALVIIGRGLGASGAFASAAAAGAVTIAPDATRQSQYFSRYLTAEGRPAIDWIVVEVVGVIIGGFLSAWFAGRLRGTIEKGPRISNGGRLALAFTGGSIMGVGAVLARGCTSGQGLTGGAMLSVGGWLFIAAAFAAAYATAPLLRRAWT
jgi:uncharacterized membrane protein YedE/YeeE